MLIGDEHSVDVPVIRVHEANESISDYLYDLEIESELFPNLPRALYGVYMGQRSEYRTRKFISFAGGSTGAWYNVSWDQSAIHYHLKLDIALISLYQMVESIGLYTEAWEGRSGFLFAFLDESNEENDLSKFVLSNHALQAMDARLGNSNRASRACEIIHLPEVSRSQRVVKSSVFFKASSMNPIVMSQTLIFYRLRWMNSRFGDSRS